VIFVLQLAVVDYATALRLQQRLVRLRQQGAVGDVLLLLQHPPVITLGRNARAAHLLASRAELAARGIEVFECDRGGDVTYHAPGQLVGYPIFDLRGFVPRLGAVEFVRRLEEALIRACADFAVAGRRIPGLTGVWTGVAGEERKLAAIGVHISRGVTSHGFALNVSTDLDAFQLIVPCGISGRQVTSLNRELEAEMARAGRQLPSLEAVAESVARNFAIVFHTAAEKTPSLEALLGREQDVPMRPPAELRRLHEDDIFPA